VGLARHHFACRQTSSGSLATVVTGVRIRPAALLQSALTGTRSDNGGGGRGGGDDEGGGGWEPGGSDDGVRLPSQRVSKLLTLPEVNPVGMAILGICGLWAFVEYKRPGGEHRLWVTSC
jgi:hypothetical protein